MVTTTVASEKLNTENWPLRSTNQITIGVIGAGGDGVIASGEILAHAAAREGLYTIMTKSYGPVIRGGESSVRIRMGDTRVHSQGDKLDVLICFSWKDFPRFEEEMFIKRHAVVLYDVTDDIAPEELPIDHSLEPVIFQVPFKDLAKEEAGSPLYKNIVMLGMLAEMFDLPQEGLEAAIKYRFSGKGTAVIEENLKALFIGDKWVKENLDTKFPFEFFYTTAPPKLLMTGNEALSYGALHAGCRFMAGYPITPASEIMEWLSKHMPKYDGTVVQAEDEMAAIGYAIGASFSGVPSMTASSGPGISLMQEMLGVAGMAEIPVVVVNVQRVGPSTGIPTKSEQADLMQAIYGSHGDNTRVVLGPCDCEDCYDMIHYAFSIAEAYQVPVIVLSDQFIGQRKSSFDNLDLNRVHVEKRKVPTDDELEDYKRYKITNSGISPMTYPGIKRGQYQASGLGHNDTGQPVSTASWNKIINDKKSCKLDHIVQKYPLTRYFGPQHSRVGILGWGSTKGVISEAVHLCGRAGIDVSGMVLRMLYPLPIEHLKRWFASLDTLIIPELSYGGQFMRHLRSYITLPPKVVHYARGGGVLIPLEDILNITLEFCDENISRDMIQIIDPEEIFDLRKKVDVDIYIQGEQKF
ncbi:MAG TPA: 2-oxoacid:acceptor oxidoreductase subunit alpha [bacterium]|jgi:2-oxoglutarate ferredoxin oxidoreductase subunit alpha